MKDKFKYKFYDIIGQRRTNRVKIFMTNRSKKLKTILNKNEEFNNIHKGKRCFIIGNGPSVKNIDFQSLANEYTFTVNQFSRFDNFEKLHINYHVFSDERIFCLDEKNDADRETLEYLKKLKNASSDIRFFSKLNSKQYIEKSKYFSDLNVNYYLDGLTFYNNYNFDYDITKQIPWFPTCVDYCIFIAMYMGFEEIYLLGCECTGFLKVITLNDSKEKNFSYGYKITDNEAARIKKQLITYGIADELEVWAKIFRYYEFMNNYTIKKGIKIVNCTDGGILNVFERKNLNDVV